MSYVCITGDDRARMLKSIGVGSIDELFADIPSAMRFQGSLNLPPALSEVETVRLLDGLGDRNRRLVSFLGAGAYDHYIPAVVDAMASRSEFYTSYTPYQPEVSQGTLTAIFEFQTFVCRLTGMDVANASMYDGATALAESVLMSLRASGRRGVLIGESVHPHYREVLKTYCWANDIKLVTLPCPDGIMERRSVEDVLDDGISAVVVQNPNFFGCIEDVAALAVAAHSRKAHLITTITEPMSLGILKSPGSQGADIVCGEMQSFGNPIGFGGPALGFLSARNEFLRRLPGRLVGKTVDLDGKEAYVLTLQTREQHIRREKSTSNICTNQGLCALRSVIYMSTLGNSISALADLNHRLAGYCRRRLIEKGFESVFTYPYFNEFALRIDNARDIIHRLREEGIHLGIHLGDYFSSCDDCVLICCTEMNTPAEVDRLVSVLENVMG